MSFARNKNSTIASKTTISVAGFIQLFSIFLCFGNSISYELVKFSFFCIDAQIVGILGNGCVSFIFNDDTTTFPIENIIFMLLNFNGLRTHIESQIVSNLHLYNLPKTVSEYEKKKKNSSKKVINNTAAAF